MKKILIIAAVVVLVAGMTFYLTGKRQATAPSTATNTTSSDNNTTTSTQSQPRPETTQQTADKVTIQEMAFSPANITVKKGTTVTWTNQDEVAHNVTETDGKDGPKSGDLAKGQSYTFTFATAGTYKYDCTIHPSMTGTVTVTE